jgi:hypothetical protein
VPAVDPHQGEYASFDAPVSQAFVVTPSDSVDFAVVTRAIYVGATGGDVRVVLAGDGDVVTFTSVPGGTFLPVAATRVNLTGTTATSLLGLR